VLAGGDADFSPTLPWLRQIAADDSPVSPRMLRALAHGWSAEARRRQIRRWAETNLSWGVKIPKLIEFLRDCAVRDGAARGAPTSGLAA
jgi:hypothetical protein